MKDSKSLIKLGYQKIPRDDFFPAWPSPLG